MILTPRVCVCVCVCRHSFDNVEDLGSASPPPASVTFTGLPPQDTHLLIRPQAERLRRISTGSMRIEVGGDNQGAAPPAHAAAAQTQQQNQSHEGAHVQSGFRKCEHVFRDSHWLAGGSRVNLSG